MDIQKFYQNNKKMLDLVFAGIIVLLVIYIVKNYSSKAQEMLENVVSTADSSLKEVTMPLVDQEPESQETQVSPLYSDGADNCSPLPTINYESGAAISPEDLLPKSDLAADFENQFPVGAGDLTSKNFLTAGFNTGINTVSSSLRNANLQLRSDPYIPPKEITPFNQTTLTPDLNRKSFEIGS
jgi:hypothetical protein